MARSHHAKTGAATAVPIDKPAPYVEVWQRRMLAPFGDGSITIELREPGWVVRIINAGAKAGRFWEATRVKGWVPVAPADLKGEAEDYGFEVKDGRVVRGERGQEILVKMPADVYASIQDAKDAHNRGLASAPKIKQAILESAGHTYGDEAASYLHGNITLKDERAPVPLDVDTPE